MVSPGRGFEPRLARRRVWKAGSTSENPAGFGVVAQPRRGRHAARRDGARGLRRERDARAPGRSPSAPRTGRDRPNTRSTRSGRPRPARRADPAHTSGRAPRRSLAPLRPRPRHGRPRCSAPTRGREAAASSTVAARNETPWTSPLTEDVRARDRTSAHPTSSIRRNSSSPTIFTDRERALSSFEPASAPARRDRSCARRCRTPSRRAARSRPSRRRASARGRR